MPAVQPQLLFNGNNIHLDSFTHDLAGNLTNGGRTATSTAKKGAIATLYGHPAYIYDAEKTPRGQGPIPSIEHLGGHSTTHVEKGDLVLRAQSQRPYAICGVTIARRPVGSPRPPLRRRGFPVGCRVHSVEELLTIRSSKIVR